MEPISGGVCGDRVGQEDVLSSPLQPKQTDAEGWEEAPESKVVSWYSPIVELVSVVVGRDDVQQEDVLGLRGVQGRTNIGPTLGSSPLRRNFIWGNIWLKHAGIMGKYGAGWQGWHSYWVKVGKGVKIRGWCEGGKWRHGGLGSVGAAWIAGLG